MALDDRRHGVREGHVRDDLGADLRMDLHPLELFLRQRARLRQNVLGHGQLADVVQQRGGSQALDVRLRHAHRLGNAGRVGLHLANVRRRRLVLGVDGQRERLDRRQVQIGHLSHAALLGIHAIEVEPVGPVDQIQRNQHQRDQARVGRLVERRTHRGRACADDVAERAPHRVLVPHFSEGLDRLERHCRRHQQRVQHEIARGGHDGRRLEAADGGQVPAAAAAEPLEHGAGAERRDDECRHAEGGAMQRIALAARGGALDPRARGGDHHRRVRAEHQQRRELERERQGHRRAVLRQRQLDFEHRGDRRRREQREEDGRMRVAGAGRLHEQRADAGRDHGADEVARRAGLVREGRRLRIGLVGRPMRRDAAGKRKAHDEARNRCPGNNAGGHTTGAVATRRSANTRALARGLPPRNGPRGPVTNPIQSATY